MGDRNDIEGGKEYGGKRAQEGSQEVAFRTISRSDNRALVVLCCRRGVKGRERERGGK